MEGCIILLLKHAKAIGNIFAGAIVNILFGKVLSATTKRYTMTLHRLVHWLSTCII
jgi:hypothetical protein